MTCAGAVPWDGMARALIAVGAALVLCIAGFGLVVYLTRVEDRIAVDNILAENLSRAVALAESDSDGRVDLRRVADFEWDRVLLVARDTPRDAISHALGFEWKGDLGFDSGELLIFMRGSEVARFADYRGSGRFAGVEQPVASIPRERAVFGVRDLVISPLRPEPR